MVRTSNGATDVLTPEEKADDYAADPSQDTFDDVVAAVEYEYSRDDHDPATSTVLTPVGLAARLCADAEGYEASSRIGFEREDVVTVEYDSFDNDDPHATPTDVVRIPVFADAATDRDVRFRDGAGEVRVFVTAEDRVEAADDDADH